MKAVMLVPLLALATGCPVFSQTHRQVGLVPPPRPMVYDGQAMEAPVRVEGRASTLVGSRPQVDQQDAGDHSKYVARDVIGGGLYGMKGETELGVSYDHMRNKNAVGLGEARGQTAPTDAAFTVAFSARRSVQIDQGWSVGLAGDIGWTRVPIARDDGQQLSNSAPLYRVGIVPSYKSGALTVFGSLQITNDIVVPTSITVDSTSDNDSEVRAGGGALIPSLGASVRFGNGMKLMTQLSKPFNTAVEHAAQLDLALGFELGKP